jgi:nucleoside-diphosphate-sugar epimerase
MIIGITGVTGTLGRRLLNHVLKKITLNDRVVCLIRSPSSKRQSLHPQVQWVIGDLENGDALQEFTQGLDVCIHLASLVGFARKQDYQRVNQNGTEALCQMLLKHAPKCRLIHCSSISVLRRHSRLTILNTDYANSKFLADQQVKAYGLKGLHYNIIYPGLIYGPEDKNFIPTLSRYLRKGVVFFVKGGELHCPAVFIDDLCELFWQVVSAQPASGREFIGVGPQEVGIHDFIRTLANHLQIKVPHFTVPKWSLMPVAIALDKLYQALGKTRAPMISMRSVDLLSIELSPDTVAQYNGDFWRGVTPSLQGIQRSLSWCKQRDLV